MNDNPAAVEMRGIHKQFGTVVASNGVDFVLRRGEVHALLGENGAGKTTLMRILYGLYHADAGEIYVSGQRVEIRSPKDAIAHGIGMVTQHFALVPPLTVTENIVLGYTNSIRLDLNRAHDQVAVAAQEYGIEVDPRALVKHLSVGQRQRVEILKALYRHAHVLILDEPTAVLVPQEVEQLFESLKRLQAKGLSVIFISHKLNEVMTITNHVTVLRGGSLAGTVETQATNPGQLARMMVGRETLSLSKTAAANSGPVALKLEQVAALDDQDLLAVRNFTLAVNAGEIVGLAGVSGNGQAELAQVLDGTRPAQQGSITVAGKDVTNTGPANIMAAGLGRIPEDRHESIIPEMTVAQNMAMEHLSEFTQRGMLNHSRLRRHADELIAEYQIKAKAGDKIRTLSGGNMQKVILARVIERNPKAIVVAQPTRGLDIGATRYVRHKLLEQRDKGAAILLISEDLDEILELADRIAVIYEGEIMGIVPAEVANTEQLGLLMSGVRAA